jgi:hypothetical protein
MKLSLETKLLAPERNGDSNRKISSAVDRDCIHTEQDHRIQQEAKTLRTNCRGAEKSERKPGISGRARAPATKIKAPALAPKLNAMPKKNRGQRNQGAGKQNLDAVAATWEHTGERQWKLVAGSPWECESEQGLGRTLLTENRNERLDLAWVPDREKSIAEHRRQKTKHGFLDEKHE